MTTEKISFNSQKRALADHAAESVAIQAINHDGTIEPLMSQARGTGQSTERTITVSLPNPNQSGSADLVVSTRPTIGYSANTLITYTIRIGAQATATDADSQPSNAILYAHRRSPLTVEETDGSARPARYRHMLGPTQHNH